ncbi:MAG: trypsin-like serine protease [Crocosphaera sp.]
MMKITKTIVTKNLLSVILACLGFLTTEKPTKAIVTVNDPDNYLVKKDQFSGVISLEVFGEHFCTGSLLDGGRHILTAAHCLTEASRLFNANLDDMTVVFSLPKSKSYRTLSNVFISPEWNNDGSDISYIQGGDVAVLKLARKAPNKAEQYKIYRKSNEINKIIKAVGYGDYGTGSTGAIIGTKGQKKLVGKNRFETVIDAFKDVLPITAIASPGSQLVSDFDNGLVSNDALGLILGINDLGLEKKEIGWGTGDSGSPAFIDGKIAGVLSYIAGPPFISSPPDIDELTNSSFGELFSHTRVSNYSKFIDKAMKDIISPSNLSLLYNSTNLSREQGIIPLFSDSLQNELENNSTVSVSESTNLVGLLGLGSLSVISLLKRKRN